MVTMLTRVSQLFPLNDDGFRRRKERGLNFLPSRTEPLLT